MENTSSKITIQNISFGIFIFIAWFLLCDLSFHSKYVNYNSIIIKYISQMENGELYGTILFTVLFFVLIIFICINRTRQWINQNGYWIWFVAISVAVMAGVIGYTTPFISKVFKDNTADYLKTTGLFIGGIVAIWGIMINNNRVKEQTKQNEIAEKGLLNTRFKDAALLLADNNTSANLSGIFALHQIAIEASQSENTKDYVKVILDILCSFIRDNSKIGRDKHNILIKLEYSKQTIIIQTVIDVLFGKNAEIYNLYRINLYSSIFLNINFEAKNISNVNFRDSYFQDCNFSKSIIKNVNFKKSEMCIIDFSECRIIEDIAFNGSKLAEVDFSNNSIYKLRFPTANIENSKFSNSFIDSCDFKHTELTHVNFCAREIKNTQFNNSKLNNVYYNSVCFVNVDFSNSVILIINLVDTILENTSLEEIIKENRTLELTNPMDAEEWLDSNRDCG